MPSIVPLRILFVCLGNICRSPLAEGVFRSLASERGLGAALTADSAGTGAWHLGEPPDPRSVSVAARHGIDISRQRCRQVDDADFHRFDLILGMDRSNLKALKRMAPAGSPAKVALFLQEATGDMADVPDPYYGGAAGFDQVYRLVQLASGRLIDRFE